MFRTFRRLLAALEGLKAELRGVCVELSELCATQKALGPAIERLDILDRQRHQFEAMCEGLLLKAEGKLHAANNAEARERSMKKSYEKLADPFAEDGLEPEEVTAVLHDDAAGRETERLQTLRLDVAPNNKALAQRAKFGLGR